MPGGAGSQGPDTSPTAFSSRAGCSFLGRGQKLPTPRIGAHWPSADSFRHRKTPGAGPGQVPWGPKKGVLGPEKMPTAVIPGEGR